MRLPCEPGRSIPEGFRDKNARCIWSISLAWGKACRTVHHGFAGGPDHYNLIHGATMQPCRTDQPGSRLPCILGHDEPRLRSLSTSSQKPITLYRMTRSWSIPEPCALWDSPLFRCGILRLCANKSERKSGELIQAQGCPQRQPVRSRPWGLKVHRSEST